MNRKKVEYFERRAIYLSAWMCAPNKASYSRNEISDKWRGDLFKRKLSRRPTTIHLFYYYCCCCCFCSPFFPKRDRLIEGWKDGLNFGDSHIQINTACQIDLPVAGGGRAEKKISKYGFSPMISFICNSCLTECLAFCACTSTKTQTKDEGKKRNLLLRSSSK